MATKNVQIKNLIIKLEELNDGQVFIEGITILLKLITNIINDPGNGKYRQIRKGNAIIKEKLLSLMGMHDVLLQIGFLQCNEFFKLPSNILIADLKKVKLLFEERLELVKQKLQSAASSSSSSSSKGSTLNETTVTSQTKILQTNINPLGSEGCSSSTGAIRKKRLIKLKIEPSQSFYQRVTFPKVIQNPNAFLNYLETMSDQCMQYEDIGLKSIGKQIIPIERLTINAQNKMRLVQKSLISNNKINSNNNNNNSTKMEKENLDPCFRDYLLVELVNWFNTEFFTWIDSMECKKCGTDAIKMRGNYTENGIRVETYTCCNITSKFYRFNDIAQLLMTRRGRCGEYANCFTFFCRCLDYDARLIYATFDHVWTEVYSIGQKRWLHVDPSENVIDAPLMYQYGWKRNVDYIIGFSRNDIQDVTWRYANNHRELLMRKRNRCTEDELLQTIMELRAKRQMDLSDVQKKYLIKCSLAELVELMQERTPTDNELKGRSSGSLVWKLSRGEQCINNFYVFKPTQNEIQAKQFNLNYSCSSNQYRRYINGSSSDNNNAGDLIRLNMECEKNWESYHYFSSNVFRKEERDWKMVYLARAEDCNEAEISWKFDFSEPQLKIKSIALHFESKTYENGVIRLVFIDEKGKEFSSVDDLIGLSTFTIKVIMSGGKGEVAWQHTQLFRQRIGSDDYPFQLNIIFA